MGHPELSHGHTDRSRPEIVASPEAEPTLKKSELEAELQNTQKEITELHNQRKKLVRESVKLFIGAKREKALSNRIEAIDKSTRELQIRRNTIEVALNALRVLKK